MANKKVKFIVECEMEERWVDHFCSFLEQMEYFGNIGHSEIIGFYCDGDGDFHPKFDIDVFHETTEPTNMEFERTDGPRIPNKLDYWDAG